MRLTIGTKIILGYIPVFIVIIIITLFTLLRLNEVNRINNEIISRDLVINKAAEGLIDILIAQESYGQRYMILKSKDILSLYWKRDQEFLSSFEQIQGLSKEDQFKAIDSIKLFHDEYNLYFESCLKEYDSTETALFEHADRQRKNAFNKQTVLLNNLVVQSKKNQMDKTRGVGEIGKATFRTVTIVSIIGIVLALAIAMIIITAIRQAIQTLKVAAGIVSIGNFDYLPSVKNKDELGDLSRSFNEMATRLAQLEKQYMDSSPLTRLPGGVAVENAVKDKIDNQEPFAFCMMDLDNFKPFNDRYGYSRGNAVIKNTARIIQESSQKFGSPTDFTGHIGGDDFALVTTPDRFQDVCNDIITTFDNQIIDFYNIEDKQKGYIQSKNRQGKSLQFPIMTISISAINSEKTVVHNYIEVGEIIAELKKYAKTFTESNLVIDRRGGKKRDSEATSG